MLKKLSILFAVVFVFSLTACKGTKTYSTEDYVNIEISGLNGNGTAHIGIDRDFYDMVDDDLFDGEATDIELAQVEIIVYESVDFSTESKTEGLSNGDEIVVTLEADNDRLKELGIKFDQKKYVYKVEGLKDPVELDVWTNVEITYSGISPNGWAEIKYNGDNEFIKNNVVYYTDSYNLENGSSFTVEARCSDKKLEENLYIITEKTKEFTVSGLAEYIKNYKKFDMSEIDNKLKSKAEYVVNNSSYATDPFVFSAKLVPGGGVTEEWKVQSIDLQPERTILFYNESQSDNIYAIFWNMNITAEKTYSSQNRDGYALNDVENFDIYILTYTSGIVEENGKINSENLQIYSEAYGNSLFGNYIGMSLDEIVNDFSKKYQGYEITE